MRMLMRVFMMPLLLAGLVAGCASERENLTPATQWTAAGLGYEIVKTKIERRLEITCNPLNIISDGSYCVSNYKPTDRQEVFCFKTIGTVDCYAEPDPYSLEGRQLPGPPRALADPRMPMAPPGRRPPPQVAVAPMGAEPTTIVMPADEPSATILEPAPAPVAPAPVPMSPAPAQKPL